MSPETSQVRSSNVQLSAEDCAALFSAQLVMGSLNREPPWLPMVPAGVMHLRNPPVLSLSLSAVLSLQSCRSLAAFDQSVSSGELTAKCARETLVQKLRTPAHGLKVTGHVQTHQLSGNTMTFSEVNKEVNVVLEAFDEVEWNTLFATYLDAQAAVEADTGTKRTFVEQYKDCLLRETPVAACAEIGDGTRYSTAALPSISDGGESLADTFTEPCNVCSCPLLCCCESGGACGKLVI